MDNKIILSDIADRLLRTHMESMLAGEMTGEFTSIIFELIRIVSKLDSYNSHVYDYFREDMEQTALATICRSWNKFRIEVCLDPRHDILSYFMTSIASSFVGEICQQRKIRSINADALVRYSHGG